MFSRLVETITTNLWPNQEWEIQYGGLQTGSSHIYAWRQIIKEFKKNQILFNDSFLDPAIYWNYLYFHRHSTVSLTI